MLSNKGCQFNDPLHGIIGLSDIETKVVDHVLFQRLRGVLQNDVLQMVFPSATHTRFVHCIGAMHVGSKMLDSIIENSSSGVVITPEIQTSLNYLKGCLRLALLLHDSHLPFSHQSERAEGVRAVLDQDGIFRKMWSDNRVLSKLYHTIPTHIEHEHFSVRVAYEILSSDSVNVPESLMFDVLAIMDTTDVSPSSEFREHAVSVWPLFANEHGIGVKRGRYQKSTDICDILRRILSSEFDADRADYLLRDSLMCGTSVGKYDLDILIKNLGCSWSSEYECLSLTLKERGVHSFEQFLMARSGMYRSIYGHSCAKSFELILQLAISEAMCITDVQDRFKASILNIKQFHLMTDAFYWEKFRSIAERDPDSYSAMLLSRTKLKHLVSVGGGTTISDSGSLIELVSNNTGLSADSIIEYKNTLKVTKLNVKGNESKLLVSLKTSNGGYGLIPICMCSDFVANARDRTVYSYFEKK